MPVCVAVQLPLDPHCEPDVHATQVWLTHTWPALHCQFEVQVAQPPVHSTQVSYCEHVPAPGSQYDPRPQSTFDVQRPPAKVEMGPQFCPAEQLEHVVVQRPPWQTVNAGQSPSLVQGDTHVGEALPGSTLHTLGEVQLKLAQEAGGMGAASTRRLPPLELLVPVPPEEPLDPPESAPPLDVMMPPDEPDPDEDADDPLAGPMLAQLPAACTWERAVAQPLALPKPTIS